MMGAMGESGHMDDDALLGLVYRGRPETVAELVGMSHRPASEIEPGVQRLAERGLVVRVGERLSVPHPAEWTADRVSADLAALRRSSEDAIARVDELVSQLPSTLRQWAVGEVASDLAAIVTRHGPMAAEDFWYDVARTAGGATEAVFPALDRFRETDPERAARFARAFADKDLVRAILPASIRDDPLLMSVTERYAAAGVQFRTLVDLPSWFWIDGDLLALPVEWGEGWPTSVLGVRNRALADAARSLFEQLWTAAAPLTAPVFPWTGLLQLMRQGVTLDAASRTSGINPRTGRRRIAAAMDHYGVSTLFALGVAWAADDAG